MTITAYMTTIGQDFWGSLSVSLLIACTEWITFLFYARSCVKEFFLDRRNLLLHTLLLTGIIILGLFHYPVHLHALLLLILSSAYMCLLTHCSWFNGVLEGSYYCLILELGKSACRDGLLAWGITRLFTGISERGLNLLLLTLYLLFLLMLCYLFSKRQHHLLNLDMTTMQAVGLLFPLFLYLAVRYVQYDVMDTLSNRGWILFDLLNYAVAACALLNLSTTESMLSAQASQSETLQQQLIMEQKQVQYTQQLQSAEDINRRYHDLKHYIQGFEALLASGEQGAVPRREETEAFLCTLRKEIDPYSRIRQTGNPIMDVLLSQRMQECQQKEIQLLPYIDARQTHFIRTMDLCTIFGNAMDNAIEATETLPKEPIPNAIREIEIKIGTSDDFLLMRFHNYFLGDRRQQDAGFLTTKSSPAGHGYGLKSITAISENYGGTVSTQCSDHEFTLTVMIPLPRETENVNEPG